MIDRVLHTSAIMVAVGVTALLGILILGSIVNRGGSLDNLSADAIKERVNRG